MIPLTSLIFGLSGLVGIAIGTAAAWFHARRIPPSDFRTPHSPPLRESELRAALCVGDETPWWRAVHQCIDTMRAQATDEAVDLDNQLDGKATYYAGAVAHLDELRAFLHEQRQLALQTVEHQE